MISSLSELSPREMLLKHREKEARKLADGVFDAIMDAERRAKQAYEQASRTRKEVASGLRSEFKGENERLKERLRFSVAELYSEKELEAYHQFVEDHENCRLGLKINGGKMPYVVQYGTGIGVCTKVVCQVCGESKDITDSSVW